MMKNQLKSLAPMNTMMALMTMKGRERSGNLLELRSLLGKLREMQYAQLCKQQWRSVVCPIIAFLAGYTSGYD